MNKKQGLVRLGYNASTLFVWGFRLGAQPGFAAVVRFADFEFDLQTGELRRNETVLRLQPQPTKVLSLLVSRAGEVVTRQELVKEVWASDTFVDFEQGLNYAIRQIRSALEDGVAERRFIETLPKRGYRFIAPVIRDGDELPAQVVAPQPQRAWRGVAAGVVLLFALGAFIFWYTRPTTPPVTEKNTILVGEFVNRTGDAVFEGTLRQGLLVQLEQSPQLRLVADEQIQDTLRMMGRADAARLSPDVAREVCMRNNAAVALDGAITLIGDRYELVLRAVDCASGDLLAGVESRAADKNHVLDAVTELASDMRRKLGESLSSVHRFNMPLASASTSSLGALQCYSQGVEVLSRNFDYRESLSWFQKAIERDPEFAMAYWAAGDVYAIVGETNAAVEYTRKAFNLRERVSERERALIEANYYYYVVGDVDQARRSTELLSKLYPLSEDAHNSRAVFAETVGQFDVGVSEYEKALRLNPRRSFLYRDLAYSYLSLDRIEDASKVVQNAHDTGLDANLSQVRYSIAFYRDDPAGMEQEASPAGTHAADDLLLAMEADTAAYFGQLQRARTLSANAADTAHAAGKSETSALYYAGAAVREALFGSPDRAKHLAEEANKYPAGRDTRYGVALAFLYAGDLDRGRSLTEQLAKDLPQDTVVRCNYLPSLEARIAVMQSKSQRALDVLGSTGSCELGLPVYSYYNWPNLYPAYIRGEAYLAAGRAREAVTEFEKIRSHRGLVLNEPIGALARLQLGRAYVMSGDMAKAHSAYQDFLQLWKNADSDIPALRQARAEFGRLE